jgi:hypothetical protein
MANINETRGKEIYNSVIWLPVMGLAEQQHIDVYLQKCTPHFENMCF